MGLQVINRSGERVDVRFDAILEKLTELANGLDQEWVDVGQVAKMVIEGLYDGVTTKELDDLAAETSASLVSNHPDYSKLAARIAVDNLHRSTKDCFSDLIEDLYAYIDPETKKDLLKIYADEQQIREKIKLEKHNVKNYGTSIIYTPMGNKR